MRGRLHRLEICDVFIELVASFDLSVASVEDVDQSDTRNMLEKPSTFHWLLKPGLPIKLKIDASI